MRVVHCRREIPQCRSAYMYRVSSSVLNSICICDTYRILLNRRCNFSNFTDKFSSVHGVQPFCFRFGPDMWLVDFDMDCSQTEGSWFEFKAIIRRSGSNMWEGNINQDTVCDGTASLTTPTNFDPSINHVAKCGVINKFVRNADGCTMDNF